VVTGVVVEPVEVVTVVGVIVTEVPEVVLVLVLVGVGVGVLVMMGIVPVVGIAVVEVPPPPAEMLVEVGAVDGMDPAATTVPRLGAVVPVLVTVRRVEPTTPTVTTPTTPP
jgi:hypothetical protein